MSPVSPELVLVDPALADSAQIASRLDDWLARTEWRAPVPAPSHARRTALAAALLASMLANGLLTSFLLFGQHSAPALQPAAPPPTQSASVVNQAAQRVLEIPPPNPALLPHTKSK